MFYVASSIPTEIRISTSKVEGFFVCLLFTLNIRDLQKLFILLDMFFFHCAFWLFLYISFGFKLEMYSINDL